MKIKTILLADDEEPVRALVAATIRDDSRYKILEAKDGMEALEIARKEKPDIILLDIMMPKMDGFEVCRQLKADPRTSGIFIIMLTALAQNTDKGKAKEVGANGYFAKPFSPTALIKKLEEVLGS
ncbi:MAG: response regulator [Dehalococcoidia bacterium]|nr:response regulator [Dehalococcoidia bacterium]